MARQRLKGRGACSTPCQAHHQRPYSSNIFLLLQGYVFPSTPQCSQGMQDANRACMTKPGKNVRTGWHITHCPNSSKRLAMTRCHHCA